MNLTHFALAHQRLAARLQQREAESQARSAERRSQGMTSGWPHRLNCAAHLASIPWDVSNEREDSRYAMRVAQVDAELLDEELIELLKDQVGGALKYFGPQLHSRWSQEILLCLRVISFKLSIWDQNASYGAALQGLAYTDARNRTPAQSPPQPWQKGLHGLIMVGGRYAWARWEEWLTVNMGAHGEHFASPELLSSVTNFLSTLHCVAAFASFLIFLWNGRYRTLVDRLVRIHLSSKTTQVRREVSFEYLNRQLVWHAFTEFLLFLLPLVGIRRWRRWLARIWHTMKSFIVFKTNDKHDNYKVGGELGFLKEWTCAVCYQDQSQAPTSLREVSETPDNFGSFDGVAQVNISNPYETIPCRCVYCYVCLLQRLDAEEGGGWNCLRCGELVKECQPWNGDVVGRSFDLQVEQR